MQSHSSTNNTELSEQESIPKFLFQNESGYYEEDEQRSQTVVNFLVKKPRSKIIQDLWIDMDELIATTNPEQLTEDGGVIKFRVREGEGPTPHVRGVIKVKYELRLEDGTLKDPTAQRNVLYKISLATSKPIIVGLRIAFMSMRAGEISWFKMVGNYNCIEGFQSDEKFFYQIEMVEHTQPGRQKDDLDIVQRMEYIHNTRIKGNKQYERGEHEYAARDYNKILNYLSIWPKSVKAPQDEIKQITILVNNNLSQALIAQKKYKEALVRLQTIKDQVRGHNLEVKTYYRLAKCLYMTDQPEQALNEIKQLETLCKLDQEQQQEFFELKMKIQKQIQKDNAIQRQIYQKFTQEEQNAQQSDKQDPTQKEQKDEDDGELPIDYELQEDEEYKQDCFLYQQ